MILRANQLVDGQVSFERGVDTYAAPVRVPRNQLTLLVNSTTRQDFVGTRPGWTQGPLTFPGTPSPQAPFTTGLFQGFQGYRPDTGPSHLVFSISGRIFRVNALTDWSVQELVWSGGVRPTNRPQAWFEQAECFLVIQDGQSVPLIYDGASIRLSDVLGAGGTDADGTPLYEVPVGSVMAYSQGRLWVVSAGRGQPFNETAFVAGDGVYGPTGTAAYNRRDAVLKFTENTYLDGGFAFAVPANMGRITAMRAIANLDTSLGQGPLQVFTPAGCFSVQAPFDRTAWALVTYPIQTVSLIGHGAQAQASTVLVNGDAWYRSLQGVDSFLIARRDFGTWGNRSMSYEVIRHLKDDDLALLRYGSAALFDNRLLVTTTPQRDRAHGVYHKGLVVLDFIPLTSMAGSEPPCWDGLWTGPFVSDGIAGDVLQVATVESEGVQHCFAAVLAPADGQGQRAIQVWELTRDQGFDAPASAPRARISRVLESPRLDWSISGSSRLEQKLLEASDMWVDKVKGIVDFSLLYRPDEYPCWLPWASWQICAKVEACPFDAVDGCLTVLNFKPGYRARLGAMRPPDAIVEGQASRMGYTFQYRLEIVGDCELTAVRLLATRVVEATFGATEPQPAVCIENVCCEPALFTP